MMSVRIKYVESPSNNGGEGELYYQVGRGRNLRLIESGLKLHANEWDKGHRKVMMTNSTPERRPYLESVNRALELDVNRITRIVVELDSAGEECTANNVLRVFCDYKSYYSLGSFPSRLIEELRHCGRIRTAETYAMAVRSYMRFLEKLGFSHPEECAIDNISSELMTVYEAWLRQRLLTANTISFYMRILRAIYNKAVERGGIADGKPFRHVYTGVDKTVKRALPLGTIRRIKKLDLTGLPQHDYARDMFMLSFYLRGMSFVDMAFLRKSDLRGGRVVYRRRKTGQLLAIAWTPEMQALLDKYPENSSDYLLPIIRRKGTNERCTYRNVGYNINHNLKRVALMAGIDVPLTLYVARHSWATAAKSKGVPLSVISEGLGHDSEATTRIYLASLETSVIDRANSLILASL